jgi:hypothetical protein
MLPCLDCGEPIQYALNPAWMRPMIAGAGPQQVSMAGGHRYQLYRNVVGERCERCAVHYADPDTRPKIEDDLQELRATQHQFFSDPPSGTFQALHYTPSPCRKDLQGFSAKALGCWVVPGENKPAVTMTMKRVNKQTIQLLVLRSTIRHENIPATLRWVRDTYERVEIIDEFQQASIAQLKTLMNGMRLQRSTLNTRIGVGGPVARSVTYKEAVSTRRILFDRFEESAFQTGVKERRPTNKDIAEQLGISPSKLYTHIREWRRKGLKW